MAVHVAQINIGTLLAAPGNPRVAEFMDALDAVNALADSARGFVWRLQTEAGNATDIKVFANPLEIVNLSVWESVDELADFVFRSAHVGFLRRRSEWFERDARRLAVWHVSAGSIPDVGEGLRRVDFLDAHGTSPYAFGLTGSHPAVLTFETTTPNDPETRGLIAKLNAELTALADDPNENHFSLNSDEIAGANGVMLQARLDGTLVGCGAVRRIGPGVGELKRMFVEQAARGHKLGAALLDQLELAAARRGWSELKLETGPRQLAALALYERAGFERCDLYGEYRRTPATSWCFRKSIAPLPSATRG